MSRSTVIRSTKEYLIKRWPAMPPEAPCDSYSVTTRDPITHTTHPTFKTALDHADRVTNQARCPLLASLPLYQEEPNGDEDQDHDRASQA